MRILITYIPWLALISRISKMAIQEQSDGLIKICHPTGYETILYVLDTCPHKESGPLVFLKRHMLKTNELEWLFKVLFSLDPFV